MHVNWLPESVGICSSFWLAFNANISRSEREGTRFPLNRVWYKRGKFTTCIRLTTIEK